MARLTSGRRTVASVFGVRGYKEVHMTDALAFVMSRVPALIASLKNTNGTEQPEPSYHLYTQRTDHHKTRTDIELENDTNHIIIEAKRGIRVPSKKQLVHYTKRFTDEHKAHELWIISDSPTNFAKSKLDDYQLKKSWRFFSWRDVQSAARRIVADSAIPAQLWLNELITYLDEHLRRIDRPDMVYIIPLGSNPVPGRSMSSIELLDTRHMYVHPVGRGRPQASASLLGFRYRGKLQSIHKVLNMYEKKQLPGTFTITGVPQNGRHRMYELGPSLPLSPTKTGDKLWRIPSGRIRNRLLLLHTFFLKTCSSLEEAAKQQSTQRQQKRAARAKG